MGDDVLHSIQYLREASLTEKRFQVFVSSTFQDLVEERREVIQALLELDCIPAGMELFPATNEDQWALISTPFRVFVCTPASMDEQGSWFGLVFGSGAV